MSIRSKIISLVLALLGTVLSGCAGIGTFHDHANAGDTIAVAAGWKHHLQRGNFEVTITDDLGAITTYTPGVLPGYDAVKASVNFYPDPISSLIVSNRTGQDVTPFAQTYADAINFNSTNNDLDWWETVIFITLPDPMALGDATIEIVDTTGLTTESVSSIVTIVGTTGGTPNAFDAEVIPGLGFNMQDDHFQSLERVDHFVVSFSGTTVPHAIQLDLTHDADANHSGVGVPYAVNPVGHIKNLSWAPTGINGTDMRVILTPAGDGALSTMNDFKFYVVGGVGNLQPNGVVQAFDSNGGTVSGVSVAISEI